MNRTFFSGMVALTLMIILLAGCGRSRGPRTDVDTAEVSGTVTLDGTPLPDAEVNFVAEKYAGIAHTAADGTYRLQAQPGENTVYIRKYEGWTPDTDPTAVETMKQLLPEKYSSPEKSELKYTVPESGAAGADFPLSR